MKKKLFVFLTLCLFLAPFVVTADCVSSKCTPSGGGVGNESTIRNGSNRNCSGWCWWGAAPPRDYNTFSGGVRVTVYVYKDKKLTKLGAADLWTTRLHTWTNHFHISSPSKSPGSLENRKLDKNGSCAAAKSSPSSYYRSWNTYKNNEAVYQYGDPNYGGTNVDVKYYSTTARKTESFDYALNNGHIGEWLYDTAHKTGWLKDHFFDYIKNGNFDAAGKTFGMESKNVSLMKQNVGNIYIVAEVLFQLTYNAEEIYSGTVSELSNTLLIEDTIDWLRVMPKNCDSNKKIGNLVCANSDKYINIVDKKLKKGGADADPSYGVGQGKVLCGNTYGLGIWYLPDCCQECKQLTCKDACKGKTGAALQTCGKTFCDTIGKNESDCLKECSFSCIGSSDCSTDDTGKCDNLIKVSGQPVQQGTCTSSFTGKVNLGTTQTCKIVNKNGINLAKIICKESVEGDISDIKNKKVVFNDYGNANLSLTFKVKYKQNCELTYLKSTKNRNGNQTCLYEAKNYNDSELKAEIDELTKLIKNIQTDRNTACNMKECKDRNSDNPSQCETFCDNMLKSAQTQKTSLEQIEKLYVNGEGALKDEMMNSGTRVEDEKVELQLKYVATGQTVSNANLSTATMKLVPVACNTTTEVEWCDPETKDKIKSQRDVITCEKTANSIKVNGNQASYEEEVYYSIPSSYIATRTTQLTNDNVNYEGKIYHDYLTGDTVTPNRTVNRGDTTLKNGLVKCQNASGVKMANGLCVEVPKTWQFDKMTESQMREVARELTVNEGLHVNISGFGSCGQFGYDLTCNYTETAYATCSKKCDNLTMGSEAFNKCVIENCGCDSLCGDNIGCRYKYCPDPCPTCVVENECNNSECQDKCSMYKEGSSSYNSCISENDCCDSYCKKKVDDKTYSTVEQCKQKVCPDIIIDQCETKCNESIACLCNCCTEKCEVKVQNGEYDTLAECKANECPECDCPKCGDDFVYRTVDVTTPFPNRNPGNNWREREKRIINDKTAASTSLPEYSITLTSAQLNDLKKIYKNEIVFKQPNASKAVKSKQNGTVNSKEYCSLILHGGDDRSKDIFASFHVNAKNACGN